MRKWIAIILCLVMLASLTACGGDTASTSEPAGDPGAGTFRAGYGRVDITPELGIGLAGYGDDGTRRAEYIRDPLYLTCVALTDENENTLLLFSCDNIRTETSVANTIRSNLNKKLGIPKENILFSSTHSHNTPDSVSGSYSTMVKNGALEAAQLALADRSTAEMYSGSAHSENLNFVRHYVMSDGSIAGTDYQDDGSLAFVGHETEVDDEVQLLKFTRQSGKDIVMMNWRAHPILDGGSYRDVTSGYIGPCREYIEIELGCNFIYFQGAAGNVSDSTRIAGEDGAKDYEDRGYKLAQCAIDAMPSMKKMQTGPIEIKIMDYTGNVRKDSAEFIKACSLFTKLVESGSTVKEATAATGGLVRSKWAIQGVNRRGSIKTFDMELAAVAIGEVAFIGTPNEMFDNTGMQIKEASPYEQTFILGYCNGRANYLPSEPAYTNGCYEKDQGYFVKGTAEEMVTVYTAMLEELHKEGPAEKPSDTFVSKLPVVIGE